MGELHLDILVDRLKREFRVEANIGKPQVAYREAIKKQVNIEAKYIRQSGGRGQYGHVIIELEPIEEVIIDLGSAKGNSQPILVHSKNKSKTDKTTAA